MMKLAFTTLGCLDWDIETIVSRAVEYGYDGVDFRGCRGQLNIWTMPEFAADAARTAGRFAEAGLEVPCFSSGVVLCSTADGAEAAIEAEMQAYLALCGTFGARFIRVFGGAIGEMGRAEAIDLAAARLKRLAPLAAERGVRILVETHDAWTTSEHLAALMQAADNDAVGVLWDIHHPYRQPGEPPAKTWSLLGRWIAYTHWKDGTMEAGRRKLCLPGRGDLPLREFHDVLDRGGYRGYAALEWERKWVPSLEPPEVAFPAFAACMRDLTRNDAP